VQEQPATDDTPKQVTPKGYEMPVPSKSDVMAFFKEVARATPKKG